MPAVLARLNRFEIDAAIRATAAAYDDPALRSLDAIHLATAQVASTNTPLAAFVVYDKRSPSRRRNWDSRLRRPVGPNDPPVASR